MEPLKPHEKQSILENSPSAEPSDLEEYERLLSARFTQDPSLAPAAAPPGGEALLKSRQIPSEQRLAVLHAKLFGAPSQSAEQKASH